MFDREKRTGHRSDLSVMCSVEKVSKDGFLRVMGKHPIPGALLDSRYDVTIEKVEAELKSRTGELGGIDADLAELLDLIVRYQKHQERMIRHLVIDSRNLHPCVVNVSISGVLLPKNNQELDVGDKVHLCVLFPGMMIPLSIPCVVSRKGGSEDQDVALKFEYRTEGECISLRRYITSMLR